MFQHFISFRWPVNQCCFKLLLLLLLIAVHLKQRSSSVLETFLPCVGSFQCSLRFEDNPHFSTVQHFHSCKIILSFVATNKNDSPFCSNECKVKLPSQVGTSPPLVYSNLTVPKTEGPKRLLERIALPIFFLKKTIAFILKVFAQKTVSCSTID